MNDQITRNERSIYVTGGTFSV